LIDALTEIWYFARGMVVVVLHEEAVTTHDLVFVNIFWDLLNPCRWGELENEGSDKDSGC
jgi:hypothetical protein